MKNFKIAFIGKFGRLHDEEYIARSFEMCSCKVLRLDERNTTRDIHEKIDRFEPDIVLWCKLRVPEPEKTREFCKKYKTVCWVFDLYFGHEREYRLSHPCFTADFVFTTDGGHQEAFKALGINHQCVRQGIFKDECRLLPGTPKGIVFVGSDQGERINMIRYVQAKYPTQFVWYGFSDTNEIRGMDLNVLYANTQICVGDSYYSPHYWSNRVVETLGRGGFLIHQEVDGLKREYPHLVTYPRGSRTELRNIIDFYLTHEEERKNIVDLNFRLVQYNYTMDKKCAQLLSKI